LDQEEDVAVGDTDLDVPMFSYRRNTPTIRRDDSSSHWLKRWATPLGTRNASTTSCERV